jgi:hypothetical protein
VRVEETAPEARFVPHLSLDPGGRLREKPDRERAADHRIEGFEDFAQAAAANPLEIPVTPDYLLHGH